MACHVAAQEHKQQIIEQILAKGRERKCRDLYGDLHGHQVWEQACKPEYDRLREEWDASGRPDWDAGNQIFWTVYELCDNEHWGWETEEARAEDKRSAAAEIKRRAAQEREARKEGLIHAAGIIGLCVGLVMALYSGPGSEGINVGGWVLMLLSTGPVADMFQVFHGADGGGRTEDPYPRYPYGWHDEFGDGGDGGDGGGG